MASRPMTVDDVIEVIERQKQELVRLQKIADWVDKVCNECPSRINCMPDDCWMWPVHDALVDYQAWKAQEASR